MSKVIGIDLGTTNSAMAYIDEAGDAEIIENFEGQRITPSVVGISDTGLRLFGEQAKNQAVTRPADTIRSAKRFIGRRFQDDAVQEEIKNGHLGFELGELENGDVGIHFDGELRSPAEISSMLLQKLKRDAEERLGESVEQAVITVPAYFNDAQRSATKVAGEIAGLEVIRIVNEPTAAALAFGIGKSGDRKIAVYDLGGGTFDISILNVNDDLFEKLSTNGDTHLGGDDFDLHIMDYILDSFREKEGIDLRSLPDNERPSAMQRVLEAAEDAKKDLSSVTSTQINVPFITVSDSGPKHIQETLTRAKLEELVEDLVDRTAKPCEQALKDAEISAEEIDDVLLVGGMTRMPAVRERVKMIFGKEPNQTINPDEVVSMGAALQAGVIDEKVGGVILVDVTPMTLGIELADGRRAVVMPRNTTIPNTKSEIFTTTSDMQTAVDIRVLQGEFEMAEDNTFVANFILDQIPPAPRGIPKIEVRFDIDINGILTVRATDLSTGNQAHITVKERSGLPQAEIDRLTKDSEEYAENDRLLRESGDIRNQAESSAHRAQKIALDYADVISPVEKRELESRAEMLLWTIEGNDVDMDRVSAQVEELGRLMTNVEARSHS